uniref:Metallophos domain-containing protein n=1 Tax=Heterorhabditis bacteriophora TaxID=37862 RepID=A0A1I7WYN5_HETBA
MSAMEFLKAELRLLRDVDIPILINMHQCEGTRLEKMKQLIGDWFYETRNYGHKKRLAVFYAHLHSKHEIKTMCFHDISVPFVYIGSVPNNRFSMLKIGEDRSTLVGFAAKDALDVGQDDLVIHNVENCVANRACGYLCWIYCRCSIPLIKSIFISSLFINVFINKLIIDNHEVKKGKMDGTYADNNYYCNKQFAKTMELSDAIEIPRVNNVFMKKGPRPAQIGSLVLIVVALQILETAFCVTLMVFLSNEEFWLLHRAVDRVLSELINKDQPAKGGLLILKCKNFMVG